MEIGLIVGILVAATSYEFKSVMQIPNRLHFAAKVVLIPFCYLKNYYCEIVNTKIFFPNSRMNSF